jgi:hypothetical protein
MNGKNNNVEKWYKSKINIKYITMGMSRNYGVSKNITLLVRKKKYLKIQQTTTN